MRIRARNYISDGIKKKVEAAEDLITQPLFAEKLADAVLNQTGTNNVVVNWAAVAG